MGFKTRIQEREKEFKHMIESKKQDLTETSEIINRINSLMSNMFDQGPNADTPIQWDKIKWLVDNFNCGTQALVKHIASEYDDPEIYFDYEIISHLVEILNDHETFMLLLKRRLFYMLYEGVLDITKPRSPRKGLTNMDLSNFPLTEKYLQNVNVDQGSSLNLVKTEEYLQPIKILMDKLTNNEINDCLTTAIKWNNTEDTYNISQFIQLLKKS